MNSAVPTIFPSPTQPAPPDRPRLGPAWPGLALWLGMAATGVVCYGLLQQWPQINGPPQWFWPYLPFEGVARALIRSLVWLTPGAALLGTVWLALRGRLDPRRRRRAGLALLLLWGFYHQWIGLTTLHLASPAILGQLVISNSATGYLWAAAQINAGIQPAISEALLHYDELLRHVTPHVSTHPPGNVVTAYGVLRLFDDWPALAAAAERVFGWLGTDFDKIPFAAYLMKASGMALGVYLLVGGLLAGLPLFALVRGSAADAGQGEREAWLALILWLHYPTLLIFTPSYDSFYSLLWMTTFWIGWRGLQSKHPVLWGLVLGAAFAIDIFHTFKLAMALAWGGLALLFEVARWTGSWRPARWIDRARRSPGETRRLAWLFSAALVAFLALMILIRLVWGIDMPAIFLMACRIQAKATIDIGRTYGVWLVWGPYDYFFFAGPALTLLALAWLIRSLRERRRPASLRPLLESVVPALAVVFFSGLVLAENSRQMLMFSPGLAWIGAAWLAGHNRRAAGWGLALLLLAQHVFTLVSLGKLDFFVMH